MKAANLHAVGDLRYETIQTPVCGDDEVLVAVKSCGICGSDIPRVYTKGTYHFPTVIGHEFSGKVVSDATGEWIGKRVAVFPLLPCFQCEACKNQQYATCARYDYYGSRRDGGMADYVAVRDYLDHGSLESIEIEVDGNVSFEHAKAMREAGANIFVCGSSSIFSKEAALSDNIARIRKIIL